MFVTVDLQAVFNKSFAGMFLMIGVSSPGRGWEFFLRHRVQTDSGAHPASYPVDIRGSFLGLKRQGHETDHSLPSSGYFKNG
jgi:hypothetical protein